MINLVTGPTILAPSWDVTRNIKDVSLTDKPNSRNFLRNMEFNPILKQGY